MNWPLVKLEDVSEFIRNGASIKQSGDAAGLPITRIETIADRTVNLDKCGYADVSEGEYINYRLRNGDILISHINSERHLAKCAIFESHRSDVVHGMNLLCLRPSCEVAFPKYLFHYLSSSEFLKFIPTITKKSVNQASFTVTAFKGLEIPLPPLPEQKRIAAILDKADAIRRKRQQAIQLADDFLRAVFLDMFGDPVTNPKGLEITSIGELCDVATGATPPRGVDEYYGGDIPWVKTGEVDGYVISKTEENITHEALSNTNCKLNPVGSIIMAMYGQGKTRGKVGILGVEAATNQACAVIKPSSKIMMEYLYFYLQISYETLRSLGQGAGQPNLNLSIVKGFPVPFPSELDQLRFVKVCESVGNLSKRGLSATQDSSELFNSLSQKAFRGEL